MIRARRELLAVLQRTRAKEVAARCRVSRSRVSKWTAGVCKPCHRARLALAFHYGIAVAAWGQQERVRGGNRC